MQQSTECQAKKQGLSNTHVSAKLASSKGRGIFHYSSPLFKHDVPNLQSMWERQYIQRIASDYQARLLGWLPIPPKIDLHFCPHLLATSSSVSWDNPYNLPCESVEDFVTSTTTLCHKVSPLGSVNIDYYDCTAILTFQRGENVCVWETETETERQRQREITRDCLMRNLPVFPNVF
jgi:hypothetical protein